jgi:hypothetical protein
MGRKKKRRQAAGGTTAKAPDAPATRGVTGPVNAVHAAAPPGGRSTGGRLRAWLPFGLGLAPVLGVYLTLKMFAINKVAGDEHIYVYQAQLIADGETPYADFAMAHPPLQALATGALLALFGYDSTLIAMVPIAWCLIAGIVLAVLVRRELGTVAAIAATALFLLAYEPLRASSHATGVNMTLALLLGAFLAFRKGRVPLAAGLCVAAVFTRLYAAPGVMALTLFALVADRRSGLKLIAWGAGFGAAVVLASGLWTGFGDMINDMLRYHAQKTPMKPDELAGMRDAVLFHNATTFFAFVAGGLALLAAIVRAERRAAGKTTWARLRASVTGARLGLPLLCALTAVAFLAILLNMDRVWMYYFVPPFPFAAVLGGWLIARWVAAAVRLVRARLRTATVAVDRPALLGLGALLAAFALALALSPGLEARLGYFQRALDQDPKQRTSSYTWRPGLLPDALNDLVRTTIWRDERTIGEPYCSFTYLLWHESRILDIADEMVAEIERRTGPDDEIFGDSGTVPLLALLSGRRIAANEVDTNIQRYRSGNADPKELVERIDHPRTKLIILRRNFGVAGVKQVRELVQRSYRLVSQHRASDGKSLAIYERRDAAGAAVR